MPREGRYEDTGAFWTDDLTSKSKLGERGTFTGSPTLTAGPLGRPAMLWDGSNDYWTSTGTVNMNRAAYTLFARIYVDSTGSGYRVISVSGAGRATFAIDNTGKLAMFFAAVWKASDTAVPTDQWVSVACTSDGTTLRFYVNGVADGTDTHTTPTSADIALTIGAYNDGTLKFKGGIANLRYWPRALTADEISAIHAGTVWDYDRTEVTALDMSNINPPDVGHAGNGNDGTGTGLVAATDIVDGPYNGEKATQYNGTDEHTTLPGSILSSNVASMTAVFKPATINSYQAIASYRTGNSDEFMMFIDSASARLTTGSFGDQVFSNNNSIAVDKWTIATVTSDGTTTRVYVDGVPQTDTGAPNFTTFTPNLYLAARDGSGFRFSGVISHFLIHSTGLLAIQHADLVARIKRGA